MHLFYYFMTNYFISTRETAGNNADIQTYNIKQNVIACIILLDTLRYSDGVS